jgi:penicillin-binding protein 1B
MARRRPASRSSLPRDTLRARSRPNRRTAWRVALVVAFAGPLLCLIAGSAYLYYVSVRLIEARLRVDRATIPARVYGRPVELRAGQMLDEHELTDQLNDLGYVQRARAHERGEFELASDAVILIPRQGPGAGVPLRVSFGRSGPTSTLEGSVLERITVGSRPLPGPVDIGAPWLAGLVDESREKRRRVPLARIPTRVVQAVLATEDRRFYHHPGIDPIRMAAAIAANLRADRTYLVGASTITQQLVKNDFLSPEQTIQRKLLEQFLALLLERRTSKDEILERYLNEVYLGHRASFSIHGVAEAARILFGKDIANVTLAEAATIAGLIRSPQTYSPFRSPERARARRNVVLDAMTEAGYVSEDVALRAAREPLVVTTHSIGTGAPHFVDLVTQQVLAFDPGLATGRGDIEIHTTLDLHLQGLAQEAVEHGLAELERANGRSRQIEAALIALEPSSGEILALVGGRSYSSSQFNRAAAARRQPGSVFKPFVYLAAFERAVAEGRRDFTPATLVSDTPTSFPAAREMWLPDNFDHEYDGLVTLRRALTRSRNVAAVRVAETAGYDRVADLWSRTGARRAPPFPSIALGAFEATPLEVATAYTAFANLGTVRPAQAIRRIVRGGREISWTRPAPRRVARAETTFLVLHMMQGVLDEGTGRPARAAGFTRIAAGKSGTTNGARDAWFAGFTPDLLTVVWVGLDDNQVLGWTGAEGALPIWTRFMNRALAGRTNRRFSAPPRISFVDIDPQTGDRAGPRCRDVLREAFVEGTAPVWICRLHR